MSQIPLPTIPKFARHEASRPLLARDADSMYWMSRYIERAEHVARLLLVNSNLLVDVGDLAPDLQQRQWNSVPSILRCPAPACSSEGHGSPVAEGAAIARYMAFDRDNPNSLYACLSRARENARGIRENISAEMWECVNTLYWSIRGDDAPSRFEESPDDFYRQMMNGSMLFQGLTDQTLDHDQRWLFTQLGKYIERIDVCCGIIETKYGILKAAEQKLEGALKNIHWMAVLRCCCSLEAYRRQYVGDMDPLRVASFLILERSYPRSIRYSVAMAHEAIAAIRAEVNPLAIDPAERILGRLDAQLEYAEMNEILTDGLPAYLQKIRNQIAETALAVQKTYFLH
jgi:uncharacterized alpha-E superfamily protein